MRFREEWNDLGRVEKGPGNVCSARKLTLLNSISEVFFSSHSFVFGLPKDVNESSMVYKDRTSSECKY